MRNHKRIILVGKAASGKDHLRKRFESRGFKYSVSYTTRPPREGEIDGKDYFFITDEQAKKIFKSDIKKHMEKAKQLYPKYNTYPLYVRVALLDGDYRGD